MYCNIFNSSKLHYTTSLVLLQPSSYSVTAIFPPVTKGDAAFLSRGEECLTPLLAEAAAFIPTRGLTRWCSLGEVDMRFL